MTSNNNRVEPSGSPKSVNRSAYSESELREYREIFDMFDEDKSGSISYDELMRAAKVLGVDEGTDPAAILNSLMEEDENSDGQIDFEEFCHAIRKMPRPGSGPDAIDQASNELSNLASEHQKQREPNQQNDEERFIRDCFHVFDSDDNGFISSAEFKFVFRELGEFPETFTDMFFQEIDLRGNGYIDYNEFATMVRNYMFDDDGSPNNLQKPSASFESTHFETTLTAVDQSH